MLAFEPEPLSSLKKRFPDCLVKVWDVLNNPEDRPGLHRTYVFDFENGLRLLISKSKFNEDTVGIHVSASWEVNEPETFDHAHGMVSKHYILLGGKGILKFLGISPLGIPHWLVVENEQVH